MTPKGTTIKIENGTDQLSYKAARNKNTNNTDNIKLKNIILATKNCLTTLGR